MTEVSKIIQEFYNVLVSVVDENRNNWYYQQSNKGMTNYPRLSLEVWSEFMLLYMAYK